MGLYTIPAWFQEEFAREFGSRLRIRWSNARDEWQIEQRVGRAKTIPRYVSDREDELIRVRDGYELVMALRQGDRMPCPECGLTIAVPVRRFAEATCDHCKRKKRDGRYRACYWPFSPSLMERLRYIDPEGQLGTARVVKELDDEEALRQFREERALRLEAAGHLRDGILECLPTWGYAGSYKMVED